ncbi:MAG: CHASE domain-containing protein [Methyloceanibacter sp.]|nr:CHASE domain-containing protein [Methyloceanibacter sp.]
MPDLSDFTRNWRPVRHVWPLVAAACLGLAVAVSAWFAVSVWEERLARAKFTAVAGDYATALQNGLDQYLGKILAVRAFYDASVEVDPDEFNLFTSQIVAGYDGAMRLVWSPRVARDERAEFEHKARERGIADYAVRTWALTGPMPVSPERDEYFPILYSTTATERAATLGTDLNSEPTRSEAIRRAGDGNIMATAQGILLRNPIDGMREGFLALIPIYRHGLPVGSIDERRRNTLGMIGRRIPDGGCTRHHPRSGEVAAKRRPLSVSGAFRRRPVAGLYARCRQPRSAARGEAGKCAGGGSPSIHVAQSRRCKLAPCRCAGGRGCNQLLSGLARSGGRHSGLRCGACLYVGLAPPCAAP